MIKENCILTVNVPALCNWDEEPPREYFEALSKYELNDPICLYLKWSAEITPSIGKLITFPDLPLNINEVRVTDHFYSHNCKSGGRLEIVSKFTKNLEFTLYEWLLLCKNGWSIFETGVSIDQIHLCNSLPRTWKDTQKRFNL